MASAPHDAVYEQDGPGMKTELREAAAVTGTSVGALKVSVHRGMAALRRALASTDRE